MSGTVSSHPSAAETQAANRYLGIPVWCSTQPPPTALLMALQQHYHDTRQKALEALNRLDVSGSSLDFIIEFYRYFYIDEPCLCKQFIAGQWFIEPGTFLNAGKVGQVSMLRDKTAQITIPLVLKSIINTSPPPRFLQLTATPYSRELALMSPANVMNNFVLASNPRRRVLLSAGGNNFTNQTCINLILEQVLKTQPNYVRQYDAFYCGNSGYSIMELANGGDLSNYLEKVEITNNLLMNITRQVLTPLSILKDTRYGFVHADLKARNVFVHQETDGSITCKLADFDKSSITWRGIRFYNNGRSHLLRDEVPFYLKPAGFYQLNNTKSALSLGFFPGQLYAMHSSCGFYLSYDVYTFLYSLLREPSVWAWILPQYLGYEKPSRFYNIWKSLWYDNDYYNVMKRLEADHMEYQDKSAAQDKIKVQLRSIAEMVSIISSGGYSLRYNVDDIYRAFGVEPPANAVDPQTLDYPPVQLSRGNHVCTSSCDKGRCQTAPYAGTFQTYTWDYC